MGRRYFILVPLALLAACSEAESDNSARDLIDAIEPVSSEEDAPANKFGFVEAMQRSPLADFAPGQMQVSVIDNVQAPSAQQPAPPGSQQQIAYSYGFAFQISREKITQLQAAHAKLCEAMGPKCRILRMSQANGESWDGFGELQLEVSATEAGKFESALTDPAGKLGGELVSSVRDGTDLSDSIIDTEARLKSRLILRDKLTAILQNNRGSVDELVKAEKAVADVNEEIDTNRSKLEQYRNRIRYSDVKIRYQPQFGQTQMGFRRPVVTAFRSIGTTLGATIAVLIYAITALIPVTLLILALRWLLHRFGLRIRFWRKTKTQPEVGNPGDAPVP